MEWHKKPDQDNIINKYVFRFLTILFGLLGFIFVIFIFTKPYARIFWLFMCLFCWGLSIGSIILAIYYDGGLKQFFKNKNADPLEHAINESWNLFNNLNLRYEDGYDDSRYGTPKVKLIKVNNVPAVKIEAIAGTVNKLLSDEFRNELQGWLDRYNCNLHITKSYYESGNVVFVLGKDIKDDRIDFL